MGDPSALIFVALAIAWAAYLIPKALEHHEASARSRGVEKFSGRMTVLARREAVSRRRTELVAEAPRPHQLRVEDEPTPVEPTAPQQTVSAAKAAEMPKAPKEPRKSKAPRTVSAARRRRRVLGLITIALVAVTGLGLAGVIAPTWIAAPVGVLVGWLVTCRVMVRGEHRRRAMAIHPSVRPIPDVADPVGVSTDADDEGYPAPSIAAEHSPDVEVGTEDDSTLPAPLGPKPTWEPQPLTLPIYVNKAPAPRRSVMTIDLESTGVWTSGHTEADSELVRQADEATDAAEGRDGERRTS
ncbi:hypothetical protein BH09ACT11_BH09ACT11_17480 [soil metagenome]